MSYKATFKTTMQVQDDQRQPTPLKIHPVPRFPINHQLHQITSSLTSWMNSKRPPPVTTLISLKPPSTCSTSPPKPAPTSSSMTTPNYTISWKLPIKWLHRPSKPLILLPSNNLSNFLNFLNHLNLKPLEWRHPGWKILHGVVTVMIYTHGSTHVAWCLTSPTAVTWPELSWCFKAFPSTKEAHSCTLITGMSSKAS